MGYRLFYWPFRGRGEQIRLLLNELGQEYEDVHVDKERDFPTLRRQGPGTLYFGSVPMLKDGDFRLVQGPVIMNYLGRKHGLMPDEPGEAARAEAMVLGAEDMRMAYFRLLRDDERSEQRKSRFLELEWRERWLPAWDGLLEINGDRGFLVGPSLTQADVAVWDVLDAIVTRIDGAGFAESGRVGEFYESISTRPAMAAYLASDRRLAMR